MANHPPIRTGVFYGWIVVAIAFITLGIAVNIRTAFSLLYPPILDEFGWDRGVTAAIFSVGFVSSTASVPIVGMLMDRFGPRFVLPMSGIAVAVGFSTATLATTPLTFYLSLGLLAVGGSMPMTYIGHSMFLPNWFVQRRGLALGIAFSGVGVLAIFIFPLLQNLIVNDGWRTACIVMAIGSVVLLVPLNMILQRGHPADIGLKPYGDGPSDKAAQRSGPIIIDQQWASTAWTLGLAARTTRFWWLTAGFFLALYAWYTVQVHQTRFLLDIGISPSEAALALALVAVAGVVGQISIGHFSDSFGREWGWTVALSGFMVCYLALIALQDNPSRILVYIMIGAQGFLGYGLASLFGPIPNELFAGKRFATIFGCISGMATLGAGFGPWFTGYLYDRNGDYHLAFWLIILACPLSMFCIWMAAPRKVRQISRQSGKSQVSL